MPSARNKLSALLLSAVAGVALLTSAPEAAAQRRDAEAAAEDTARTAVQTIYHNLIKAGYDWPYIRDEKMPEILVRAVDAIDRMTNTYDRSLIVGTFIPTYIRAYYDEIDKLNAQHQVRCIDVKFVEITLVPFLEACVDRFSGRFTVQEIVVPVLRTEYSFKVCGVATACQTQLSQRFNTSFNRLTLSERDFASVCVSGS